MSAVRDRAVLSGGGMIERNAIYGIRQTYCGCRSVAGEPIFPIRLQNLSQFASRVGLKSLSFCGQWLYDRLPEPANEDI